MIRWALLAACTLLLTPASSSAQLTAAKDGPIVYGHHHLAVSDVAAHRKFWIETLGGTAVTLGSGTEAIRFPNVYVLLRAQKPTGGSKGTTVNHVGFSVPNLRAVVDKVKANGFRMVTREEAAATQGPDVKVEDDIAVLGPGTAIAFVMAPDEVKVELVEARGQAVPITMHHVHFFGEQNSEMQAWYARVFGAQARAGGGQFLSATLPGVQLNFSPSKEPVAGTRGRSIDHIGFEVKGLEAFVKRLEAEGVTISTSYRQVPKTDMWIAFITDPWGTSIELSEGLAALP